MRRAVAAADGGFDIYCSWWAQEADLSYHSHLQLQVSLGLVVKSPHSRPESTQSNCLYFFFSTW